MRKKTSSIAFAITFMVVAPSAFAQTAGGYIRETPRLENAELREEIRIKKDAVLERAPARERIAGSTSTPPEIRKDMLIKAKRLLATTTKEEIATLRLEKRAKIEALVAQKKLAITTEMFLKIKERTDKALLRIDTAIAKLSDSSTALRARAVKISEKGIDVSETLAVLSDVDERIASLKIAVTDLGEDAELAVASTTPREAWKGAGDDIRAVLEEMRSIRDLLKDAVALLKKAVRESGFGSGSSAAVSQSPENESSTSTSTGEQQQ